ncbi:hypothetical protein GUITHDRAFT_135674 [Guillardia theta CCMP2712]|uniref:Uncharacterized protein n=1 Tax=Guillardia theta (strain CCMP2712) TaxID=905079 RepID=L1JPK5_GUITC|nr:hypothetical protein GUITHDRAFT_135674 [Guillardia theta CCMP2712]EKX49998.1 hypothetical protein GUITHDRAFT_135674 [Guillardia theta CCMP2712]|eukprot:XP_005836978.1 hypothetical protein GUITHDRAFT_135674 [Guillardia theta CCMP2712]
MEWLQKAGDLLDKLDRTAAETLEAVSNDAAADADELKILMVGTDMAIPLPCMRRLNTGGKVEKLSKALAKKSSQLDQAQREVEKAVTEQNKHRQAEQQAQLQTNAMRESLKAKADEIESMQRYMDQLRRENEEYSRRVIELEKSLEEQEESKDFLQRKYEEAQKQVEEARAEHKNQLLMFQDREQSLSSETVQVPCHPCDHNPLMAAFFQFTRELAAAERRRQESEAAAKEAEERLCLTDPTLPSSHTCPEGFEHRRRTLDRSWRACKRSSWCCLAIGGSPDPSMSRKEVEEHKHESQVLRSALKAKERHCEELREEFDNQTKGIRKKLEEAELQVRQLERTSHVKPHVREVNDNELEAQLNKMCEEVLAKQVLDLGGLEGEGVNDVSKALLESLMSEKTALRSRLESEVGGC